MKNEDPFGFANAIQLDHLNFEQLKELEKIITHLLYYLLR